MEDREENAGGGDSGRLADRGYSRRMGVYNTARNAMKLFHSPAAAFDEMI